MSQPNSADREQQAPVQKQPFNVYTVMLIIAFCAITLACLLLYLELRRWGSFPWWKAETGGGAATSYLYEPDAPAFPDPCRKPDGEGRPDTARLAAAGATVGAGGGTSGQPAGGTSTASHQTPFPARFA